MTEGWWNVLVWGVGWIGLYFGIAESLAAFGRRIGVHVPWTTFSRAVWDVQARWGFLTAAIVAIFAVLASHLVDLKNVQEGDRQSLADNVRQQRQAAQMRHALKVINRADSRRR